MTFYDTKTVLYHGVLGAVAFGFAAGLVRVAQFILCRAVIDIPVALFLMAFGGGIGLYFGVKEARNRPKEW